MPSLGETYERRAGVASRRQVILGTGLFASGALLVVGAIVAGATGLLIGNGFTLYEGREIAGILAGIGLPAVFVGITIVLPATSVHRAAAVVGSGLAVLGVGLFRYAYPEHWYSSPGVPTTLVLGSMLVYFAGVLVTFWSLFTAVATFKTRNDPGGTVSLTVSKGSAAAKAVEAVQAEFQSASKALSGLGGIGTFGGVDTATEDLGPTPNMASSSVSDGGEATDAEITEAGTAGSAGATGSAGTAGSMGTSGRPSTGSNRARPSDEGVEVVGRTPEVEPDRYCGNCAHFDYAPEGADMEPYCELYEERMDDVDACEWWEQNT